MIPFYPLVTQKKRLSAPTCMHMILARHGTFIDPKEIAYNLDAVVLEGDINLYNQKLISSRNIQQMGLELLSFKENKVCRYLHQKGCKSRVHLASSINNFTAFLKKHLGQDHDVLMNVWMQPLLGRIHGHYILAESITGDEVKVCDPHFETDNYWTVPADHFAQSMSSSWDGCERRCVVFYPPDKI